MIELLWADYLLDETTRVLVEDKHLPPTAATYFCNCVRETFPDGRNEVFVLPRGAGGRLPWRHAVNVKAGVRYKISKDNVVEFTADIFNVFNFQALTSVDSTITNSDVLPFQTSAKDPQAAACLAGNDLPQCAGGNTAIDTSAKNADGSFIKLTRDELNTNFKRPTSYQAPISVRFGIRFSF